MSSATLSLQYGNTGPIYGNTNIVLSPATPTVGEAATIQVTVYNTGDAASTLTDIHAYVCPGGLANFPTWGDITQNPIGDLIRFSPSIPAATAGIPGSASFQGLTWTPDSAEANHSCIIMTAAANGVSFNPDPSTLWSDLQTNVQTGWLNVTVLTISVSDPSVLPIPPIFGLTVDASVDSPSAANRTIRIPLHADPAATRNASLVTQRVLPSAHNANPGVASLDSQSAFGLKVDESGGELGKIGSYVTEIVYLEITVPTDVTAGTHAVFDVATERDGATFNGYRVVLKFV